MATPIDEKALLAGALKGRHIKKRMLDQRCREGVSPFLG
jgi:hypothetical protein